MRPVNGLHLKCHNPTQNCIPPDAQEVFLYIQKFTKYCYFLIFLAGEVSPYAAIFVFAGKFYRTSLQTRKYASTPSFFKESPYPQSSITSLNNIFYVWINGI